MSLGKLAKVEVLSPDGVSAKFYPDFQHIKNPVILYNTVAKDVVYSSHNGIC